MSALRAWVKANPVVRSTLFTCENVAALLRPSIAPRPAGAPRQRRWFLTACVRAKDEARFLPEWIAHHVGLGVGHVFVYDNNSSDDLVTRMRPFVERGLVTHIPWPVRPASPACYHDLLRRLEGGSEWVAFFDADEFLVEKRPGAWLEALRRAGPAPAVAVNWRYFGSAGFERVPRGLVTANFTRADAALDRHVKVIARPEAITRFRNSHNFFYRGGRLARTVDGRRVLGSFARPAADPDLVLHHYVYRSLEDYERKARAGFVDRSGAAQQARRVDRTRREFSRHNDCEVRVPSAVLEATRRLLAEAGMPRELYAER